MNQQLIFGVAAVPAIIGLVQVAKNAGLPVRFAPALAVVFGVLAATAQIEAGKATWIPFIFVGVSLGLAASGLYSGVQTTISRQR